MQPDLATDSTLISNPTQHALLVAWGHFAQSLALPQLLQQVSVHQKTVHHTPAAKLTTLLIGILAGVSHLSELQLAATPLIRDAEVATAWDLPALVEPSGISRTLAACSQHSLTQLQTLLDDLAQPYLQRAIADLRAADQPLLLDVDLTGRPVSATSVSYPDAAFGYMDGEVRQGYQLAAVCLHTRLFGRQWLVGHHHPGDTVSASCLLELVSAAEARLGLHPRRRTELLDSRIAQQQQTISAWQQQSASFQKQADDLFEEYRRLYRRQSDALLRISQLHYRPVSEQQSGPYGALSRAQRAAQYYKGRCERTYKRYSFLQRQSYRYRCAAEQEQQSLDLLLARRSEYVAQNQACPAAPRCVLRMDAGFSCGENLTAVLELGYDIETKSASAALAQSLLAQVAEGSAWQRVGKNAAMQGWTDYRLGSCPYPLTVGLERFHTPQGLKYAVLLRNQAPEGATCPDLTGWFHSYNGRQSIEAGFKEEKGIFYIAHMMSRQRIGMQIQVALSLFAANFVRWAAEWLQGRMIGEEQAVSHIVQSVKQMVRVGANSPAAVEYWSGQKLIRFSDASSLAGLLICLMEQRAVQLALPLFTPPRFCSS